MTNILLDLIEPLRARGWNSRFLTLESPAADPTAAARAAALGCPVETLNCAPRDLFGAGRALGKRLAQEFKQAGRPALLHTHLGRADILTSWAKPKAWPQITTFHSLKEHFDPLIRPAYAWTEGRVACRTGVSQAVLDSFYGPAGRRGLSAVVPNPVQAARLRTEPGAVEALQRRWGLKPGTPLWLSVGRFIPAKGLDLLLTGFAEAVKTVPNLRLALVGAGPLEGALKAQAVGLGVAERIVWPGFVHELGPWMALAEVFVFTSRSEGLGLAPLEALAAGLPVLSSDLPAVTEYFEDGVHGFLFPQGQAAGLVEAWQRWQALSPVQRQALAASGPRLIARRFDPEAVAGAYAELYKRIQEQA